MHTIYGGETKNGIVIEDMIDNNDDAIYPLPNRKYFVRISRGFPKDDPEKVEEYLTVFAYSDVYKPIYASCKENGINVDSDLESFCFWLCKNGFPAQKNWILIQPNPDIEDKAYDLYQTRWLIENGFTINDFYKRITNISVQKAIDCKRDGDENIAMQEIRDDFEISGFEGKIWSSKEDFLNNEYIDPSYMAKLFINDKDYFEYLHVWNKHPNL